MTSKQVNVPVTCPNCESVNNANVRKYGDVVASIEKCHDHLGICGLEYIVAISEDCAIAYADMVLTGIESQKHLKILLGKRGVITPSLDQIAADEEKMIGLHYDGRMWVAFDNSEGEFLRVERFKKEFQAIEWLGKSVIQRGGEKARKEEALARRLARSEMIDKLLLSSSIFGLLICGLVFFANNEAHADNLNSLAAFTQVGAASHPVKKAYFNRLDYQALKDAVADGKVETTYAAIAAFAKTSPNETTRAIKLLERDGVIRWNKKTVSWELVK